MGRLLVAIGLSLALAAPAFAQGNEQSGNEQSARITQSGDSNQRRIIQQGDSNSDVSITQTDDGDGSRSESISCHGRDGDATACVETDFDHGDNAPAPRGGVDSGLGGMARQAPGAPHERSNVLPFFLGGVLLTSAAVAGACGLVRRRGAWSRLSFDRSK